MNELATELKDILARKTEEKQKMIASNLEDHIDFTILDEEIKDGQFALSATMESSEVKLSYVMNQTTSRSIYEAIQKFFNKKDGNEKTINENDIENYKQEMITWIVNRSDKTREEVSEAFFKEKDRINKLFEPYPEAVMSQDAGKWAELFAVSTGLMKEEKYEFVEDSPTK